MFFWNQENSRLFREQEDAKTIERTELANKTWGGKSGHTKFRSGQKHFRERRVGKVFWEGGLGKLFEREQFRREQTYGGKPKSEVFFLGEINDYYSNSTIVQK